MASQVIPAKAASSGRATASQADLKNELRQTLGDAFSVLHEIGRGGMAVVFLVEDCRSAQRFAVKILRPEIASLMGLSRFQREIQVLTRLRHPYIVPIVGSGRTGRTLYFAMPFESGESLRHRLNRGIMSVSDLLTIVGNVASALDYCHAQDIVHRDVKPENIILTSRGALLCDFGIAQVVTLGGGERLSSSGLVIGTPNYMGPEQARGAERLDGRADIYALGCVMYEMMVGHPPFIGPSDRAVFARHAFERPWSIRVVRPEVPRRVETAILRALAKSPIHRPRSGAELMAMLPDTGRSAQCGSIPSN